MIQIKRSGKVIVDDPDGLRSEFARRHCIRLPQLLEPDLREYLRRRLAATQWITKLEQEDGEEFGQVLFVPDHEPVAFVFRLLLNNRELFQALESVTGCAPIENFLSRIHRSVSSAGHQIDWHGDNTDHRRLGLTIQLGGEEYEGGLFQLRRKESEQVVCEVPRGRAGDAFVFQIAPELQHRLSPVECGGPRTVGVGWFRSQPDFRTFARSYFQFS